MHVGGRLLIFVNFYHLEGGFSICKTAQRYCLYPLVRNHNLESRLPGEISTTSDMQMISLQWQKEKVKSLLIGVKRRVEKLA